MKHTFRLLAAMVAVGIAALCIWILRLADDRRAQTVYVRNVPYTFFLGHVVKENGKLRLAKRFPLYDDDWRDGIWSARCWDVDPLEKINFRASKGSPERHGIILYTFDRKWRILWFDFDNAQRIKGDRLAWPLLPDWRRENWDLANGEIEIISREELEKFGIKELIDCQVEVGRGGGERPGNLHLRRRNSRPK